MSSVTQDLCPVEQHELDKIGWIGERSMQVKVAIESSIALAMLVITAPIILLVIFLVRLTSRGPVFYTQKRVGQDGRCFSIYKIRTMRLDSEPDGPRWCVPGDPRVTPLGRVLRLTHLDELPQLVNILQGDMALIGPRPERPEIVAGLERVFPDYPRRHRVRPGLTGLAQVLQAPDTDLATVRRKLHYDLHYLDHWNFWLDLRILLGTVLRVLAVPTSLIAFLVPIGDLPEEDSIEAAAHETSFASALSVQRQ
jgi:lipopolysaccharide/colanic/teichoic acid biosynthesis glycosyltransferase